MPSVKVERRGPIFDRALPPMVRQFRSEVEAKTAELGAVMVRTRLNKVLKTQTPYYRTKIAATDTRIHDSLVVYGPWLEGTGRRNRTTRFKGYHTFRLVTQQLQREMPSLANAILTTRYLPRMRGG